jgi:ABC-type transporter Mla MlaB component
MQEGRQRQSAPAGSRSRRPHNRGTGNHWRGIVVASNRRLDRRRTFSVVTRRRDARRESVTACCELAGTVLDRLARAHARRRDSASPSGLAPALLPPPPCTSGLAFVDEVDRRIVRLAGRLAFAQVHELMRSCEGAAVLELDLTDLGSVDAAGIDALTHLRTRGARLIGVPVYIQLKLDSRRGGDRGPAGRPPPASSSGSATCWDARPAAPLRCPRR